MRLSFRLVPNHASNVVSRARLMRQGKAHAEGNGKPFLRRDWTLVPFLMLTLGATAAAGPMIHGYGTHGCPEYLDAYKGWEAGDERGIMDYVGYEQWLAGLVSGLSLATGEDTLRGVKVDGLMRRIKLRCEDERDLDVLAAARAHIAELSTLR